MDLPIRDAGYTASRGQGVVPEECHAPCGLEGITSPEEGTRALPRGTAPMPRAGNGPPGPILRTGSLGGLFLQGVCRTQCPRPTKGLAQQPGPSCQRHEVCTRELVCVSDKWEQKNKFRGR